jgi:hypothetical protein
LLVAATMLSGCRFWYKPVPVANAIGEEEAILSGDTVNVHRGDRFEVYGPNSEAVYDGYEQLNRAYRAFEKHFGASAPKLAFLLARDSTAMLLDSATVKSFRDRDLYLIRYQRPRNVRSRARYGGIDYGGVLWPIAPTAARAMLARFAERHSEGNGDKSDDALLERFPLWFRAAVLHLVGQAAVPLNDLEYLRERRSQWLPMRDLLVMVRPADADSTLDPSRRDEADDVTRILAAQSSTFGRYLIEREGPTVLGRLARGYLAGRTLNDLIGEFRSAPRTVSQLEQRWRVWVDTRQD